jgi:glutamate N-acetyltransferase/amino-acid N-acetyltransferase
VTEKITSGGVTTAAGFRAAGVRCGIRKNLPDLALIVSDTEAAAAAVFTRNLIQAAPVTLSKRALIESAGHARAIIVNSGNANACTGPAGERAALDTVRETARLLDISTEHVLVASTGVIGQQLPVDRLLAGLPAAVAELSTDGGAVAAEAILTTDTCTKECAHLVESPAGTYTIGGMAKGSGMIHPDMATTLAFITTDAAVSPPLLQSALRHAVDRSFNRITVDGDTSTNDMVALLANGATEFKIDDQEAAQRFQCELTEVLVTLARAVARDGEGATRLITVTVTGAACEDDALQVARTVSGSPLVKTAVHGADANWGRIVAAVGRAGVDLEPEKLAVRINGLAVMLPGFSSDYSEEEATEKLQEEEVVVEIDLGGGDAEATTWTCDLTSDYIAINAHYRT